MPSPQDEKDLQTLRISDFSAGIVTFSRGVLEGGNYFPLYPASAPAGSASFAVRCYYMPNVGLVPFPTYKPVQTNSIAAGANALSLSLCNMMCLDGAGTGDATVDHIVSSWISSSGVIPGGTGTFTILRMATTNGTVGTGTQVYSSTQSTYQGFVYYPMMDIGEFQSAGTYARCVITTDPFAASPGAWVTVRAWNSAADSTSGALASPPSSIPRIFYHAERMGVWQTSDSVTTDGFTANDSDQLNVSTTPFTPTPFTESGLYFPEMGTIIGTWGSISTGELFVVYNQGGGVVIYGDMLAPSSALKLPGVVGTGFVLGKAASTPAGMIYATDFDGAYAWNGDNVATKISTNVPDDQLYRKNPNIRILGNAEMYSSNVAWGQLVMFPGNWVYDTLTSAWWQSEDPTVLDFQVNAASSNTGRYFYTSPALATAAIGSGVSVTIYQYDKTLPATTWTWISNPIVTGASDALISLQKVEICASNVDSVAATITITPTVPPGQAAYPVVDPVAFPNNPQPMTFTIPANTNGWRGSLRFGYTDYNIELRVDAAGTNIAPILHELSPSYTIIRIAGVQ